MAIFSALYLLFGAGLISLFLRNSLKGILVAAGSFLGILVAIPSLYRVLSTGREITATVHLAQPAGDASFIMDPLAAFFILLILLGGFLASIYSLGYMKPYAQKKSLSTYYFFLPFLTACMMLVVLARNSLVFLTAWEMMSAASFFLVVFEDEKPEVRKAGMTYLVAMQAGALLLITAFALAALKTGTFDIAGLGVLFQDHSPLAIAVLILFFLGFGVKAGLIPVHTWLPQAHPAAPSPVSALMSGVMIKTGIYGILRILTFYGNPEPVLAFSIFCIGLISGLYGVIHAIAQKDLKKLLAYSSIENIGIIVMGIGLGLIGKASENPLIEILGYSGALFHMMNHFLFKSALFYGAGSVYLGTHTRNMEKLGGLVHRMPLTAGLFLIASMAIMGLPLLNGFMGEFILYTGFFNEIHDARTWAVIASILGLGGLSLIGILVALCFAKAFSIVFLGIPRTTFEETIQDPPATMLGPMIVLAIAMFVIGLIPQFILPLLAQPVAGITGIAIQDLSAMMQIPLPVIFRILMIFSASILGLLSLRYALRRRNGVQYFRTWDCGSRFSESRIQYTGFSFAAPFLDLTGNLIPGKNAHVKPQGVFPKQAEWESRPGDCIDARMIQPAIRGIFLLLKPFKQIQTGKTRQYLLYGLIFLVLILLFIFGMHV